MPQYDQFGRRVLSTAAPVEVATGGTGAHDWLVIDAQSSADALLLNLAKPTLVQSIPGGSSFKKFERFYVFGGAGDDHVAAGTDFAYILGGDGNDVLTGGSSTYIDSATGLGPALYGGNGSDTLTGGTGSALLSGDAGDDFIFGGTGSTLIYGGDGADIIYGETATIYGGDGNDNIDSGGVLYGDAGDDHITLSLAGVGYGGDGNDTLDAYQGWSTLYGGLGDDILIAGVDGGHLEGGEGLDTFYSSRKGAEIIAEWGETVYGGSGMDEFTLDLSAQTDAYVISFAKASRQIVYANGGTVNGVDHVNLAMGSGDDNVKLGKWGGDVSGGAGNDTLAGGTGGVAHLYGGDGNDTLRGSVGDNLLVGGAGNDQIIGGTGRDDISGNEDNDVLRGGDGNDHIDGGDGADKLYGDGGDDILIGGLGSDTLTGGLGFNSFVFRHQDSGGAATDTITDFDVLMDTLVLEDAITSIEVGRTSTTAHLSTGDDIVFMGNIAPELQTYLATFLG